MDRDKIRQKQQGDDTSFSSLLRDYLAKIEENGKLKKQLRDAIRDYEAEHCLAMVGCSNTEEHERLRAEIRRLEEKEEKEEEDEKGYEAFTCLLQRLGAVSEDEEGFEAFTCPECESHRFGTVALSKSTEEWTVHCQGLGCNFGGPYRDHVSNERKPQEVK